MKNYIEFSEDHLPDVDNPEWVAYWEGTRQGEIRFPKCKDCNQFHWYLAPRCPFCHSANLNWEAIPTDRPKLYTWTYMRTSLTHLYAIRGPYIVIMVEFEDVPGIYLTSNLVECKPEDVKIGMPLELVFQKVDDKITMPLFRPVKG